jgi:hypothetical protein
MPRINWLQHETRHRRIPSHLPAAHGGRIPRAGYRRPATPEAGYRGPGAPVAGSRQPAPEAGYRPGTPFAGGKFPAPVA